MNCPICHERLQSITYQARSADEAPKTITVCTQCQLDTDKASDAVLLLKDLPALPVDSAATPADVYALLQRRPQAHDTKTQRLEHIAKMSSYYTTACAVEMTLVNTVKHLVVTGEPLKRLLKHIGDHEPSATDSSWARTVGTNTVSVCSIGARIGSSISTHTAMILGGSMLVLDELHELVLAPRMKLKTYSVYRPADNVVPYTTKYSHVLKRVKTSRLPMDIYCVAHSADITECYIVIPNEADDIAINGILHAMMAVTGTIRTIQSVVAPDVYRSLHTLTAPAFDTMKPPKDGYLFTCKPDGERCWLIKYGCVWLMSRRNRDGRIYAWHEAIDLTCTEIMGPVLDVEVVYGEHYVLIDVLMDERGALMNRTRTIENILATFKTFRHLCPFIMVRDYFRSYDAAVDYATRCPYPTDGVIGIHRERMVTIKIKPIKSIELRVAANGRLLSGDGHVVATIAEHDMYPVDSVVELRLAPGPDKTIKIVDTLLRYDKTDGNLLSACKSIMQLITSDNDVDPTVVKRSTGWCLDLRELMYNAAREYPSDKRIIMDIGSGRGQSSGFMVEALNTAYLLVEPDQANTDKLRRANRNLVCTSDLNGLLSVIQSLVSGKTVRALYIGRIEDILGNRPVMQLLRKNVRCVVSAFSISYVYESLMTMARMNIPVIGCGYLYTDIPEGMYLINYCGIIMQNIGGNQASVKWPDGTLYVEPLVTKWNLVQTFDVFEASDILEIYRCIGPDDDITPVCSNISVVVYGGVVRRHVV